MALPIAPTPLLTGKSAEALDAYMAESEFIRDKPKKVVIDPARFARAYAEMDKRGKVYYVNEPKSI